MLSSKLPAPGDGDLAAQEPLAQQAPAVRQGQRQVRVREQEASALGVGIFSS